jgi:hypothetical protein
MIKICIFITLLVAILCQSGSEQDQGGDADFRLWIQAINRGNRDEGFEGYYGSNGSQQEQPEGSAEGSTQEGSGSDEEEPEAAPVEQQAPPPTRNTRRQSERQSEPVQQDQQQTRQDTDAGQQGTGNETPSSSSTRQTNGSE